MSNLDLSIFEDRALIHNAGLASFRSMYEATNPPPMKAILRRESVFVPIALCIMIVASVLVSGSRTVIEFGGGIVGVSAFVMLEGAIVTYAFFRTRLNFDDSRMESVRRLANRGLSLSFVVAVAANVHSVIRGAGIETPPMVTITILILVAVSAPTLAFISGDIMALEMMRNGYRQRKLDDEYETALTGWNEGLRQAWARERHRTIGKLEPITIERENTVNSSNLQENTRFVPSRKLQMALDYFELHPEDLGKESRKLQEVIGVSHTTINKAQRMKRG